MTCIGGVETRRADGTHRVVITGTGAVTPAGVGVDALFEAVMEPRCCIGPITHFDTELFDVHIAAEVRDFDAVELGLTKKEARRFPRYIQYAFVAADEAMAQAGFDTETLAEGVDLTRFGCVFGTGIGGLEAFEEGSVVLNTRGPKRMAPLFIPTVISNMASGNLSIRYGLKGECSNVVTACSTGTHCIGSAYRSIKHGYLDAALAGGAEESVTPVAVAGFSNLGALSRSDDPAAASMPFDARRSGFVAGEGAGAVVLESLEHALNRGANIIAEIVGFGSTGDAYHMTAPDPDADGLLRAMRFALEEGGFTPADLGHVNAHGTSTPANDKTEARAVVGLCGEGTEVPVVSIKGVTGHMLGGAGAVEAIVCARSVVEGCVPPTAGYAEPDPECPVRVLREPLRDYSQKVALSNSLGFGGHNGVLAFAPYEG